MKKALSATGYRKAFLTFLCLFIIHKVFTQEYNYKHFNVESGLPQSFIYSISQDTQGYLWVGTGNGLARFNGFAFETFTTDDSLSEDFVTCSLVTGDKIWFGYMNGKLTSYDGSNFKTVNSPFPSQSPITGIVKNTDGSLWVSSYSEGIVKVKNESSVKHYPLGEQIIVKCIKRITDNELLIGTNTGLLLCRIKNSQAEVKTILEIPENKITSIKENGDKGFFVATEEDGIFEVMPGNSLKVSKVITEPSDFTGIQDIHNDKQNNLWISTFGDGIVKLTSTPKGEFKNPVYFNKANGFATDNNKVIFEDREGNLWCGHFGEGLTQITEKTFFPSNKESNILSVAFNNLYRWLGTDSGLIKTDRVTSKQLVQYKNKGLPVDRINSLYSPDGKELWIGTGKNGVFRLEMRTDKIQKQDLSDEDLSNSINIITGKGEEVWIGTKKGLCNINLKDNYTTWYSLHKGGLPHNYINTVYIDNKNKVWVGTRSGILSFIENKKVNKIKLNSGNGNFELSAITEDANSRIWVGSFGKGVFIIDSTDSIANLTTKEGLLSDYCYSLITENSNIWIGHKGGLSKITNEFSIIPIVQLDQNVVYNFNPNAALKDSGKNILLGSHKGLILYNPAKSKEFVAPVLGITSLKIKGEYIPYKEKIILPAGNYKIRIDFLGISLKQPDMVTYQYKLEGYEQWSDITKNTSVTYSNLSEGNYKFLLKATGGEGAVTKTPLTFTIQIKKPVWKRWWFFPLSLLILFLITFSYIKRREYRFSKEKKLLEEKVLERTTEIQLQKTEIEKQRDFIRGKNLQITSSIRYARHIQNAILPSTELLNKYFPNYFLLSKPKDIVSGDFFWVAEKDSKVIFAVADCTGHGVPGAFMSLLGITILNEIVNIHGITNSPAIATRLRERIIESLQQNIGEKIMSDGMDMTLCAWDRNAQTLVITGAKQDLLMIRDGKSEIIKGDRFSVNAEYDTYKAFTSTSIELNTGDLFYMFTDGYKDQFGGEMDKKFMSKRLYNTLLKNHQLSMEQQKTKLEKRLEDWMGENEQTDDITVMGIKI
jgi:ligand-binding sensor domain-containing protein/serine phosphatase RsbU (regulator of sigma subunit)